MDNDLERGPGKRNGDLFDGERGREPGDGGATAPGKRTPTQNMLGPNPQAHLATTMRLARAAISVARDAQLPALRASIAARSMKDARRAAEDLEVALATIDRELGEARRLCGRGSDEGMVSEIAELTAARDSVRADSEPLLALAPPPAPALPDPGPWALAYAPPPESYHQAERENEQAWNDQLGIGNIASAGVAGEGGRLPHVDAIQASFGKHDISGIRAHVGGEATTAAVAIGAEAYATGNNVAFASEPSLFVAAHEAAHVIQQRAGVQLLGGIGRAGDAYEQNADEVAARVVRGVSSEDLLGDICAEQRTATSFVQRSTGGGTAAAHAPTATITAVPASQSIRVGDGYDVRFASSGADVKKWNVTSNTLLTVNEVQAAPAAWTGRGAALQPGVGSVVAFVERGQEFEEARAVVAVGSPTVVDFETTRTHQPAGFDDAAAGVLYPGDLLRVDATLGNLGDAARMSGEIVDSSTLLRSMSSNYDAASRKLTAKAEAVSEGTAHANLGIRPEGGAIIIKPLQMISVLPQAQGIAGTGRGVDTRNIDDAKGVLTGAVRSLLSAQRAGVELAQVDVLTKNPSRSMPWYAALLMAAAESAVGLVTGGFGTRIGRLVAGRISGGATIATFDVDGAFTTASKDAIKASIKALPRWAENDRRAAEGGVIEESWAIDAFCESQKAALEAASIDLETAIHNDFQTVRDLEAREPGSGLSLIEAYRAAIAENEQHARAAQHHETIKQWLLHLAQSTHGVTSADGKQGGSDLSESGRGEVRLTVEIGNLVDPVRVTKVTSTLTAVVFATFVRGKATLRELGLPITVETVDGLMRVGRGETGEIFVDVSNTKPFEPAEYESYLMEPGGGDPHEGASLTRNVYSAAGARKIFEHDILDLDPRTLPGIPEPASKPSSR